MIDRKQAIKALENLSLTEDEANRLLDATSDITQAQIILEVQKRVKKEQKKEKKG